MGLALKREQGFHFGHRPPKGNKKTSKSLSLGYLLGARQKRLRVFRGHSEIYCFCGKGPKAHFCSKIAAQRVRDQRTFLTPVWHLFPEGTLHTKKDLKKHMFSLGNKTHCMLRCFIISFLLKAYSNCAHV